MSRRGGDPLDDLSENSREQSRERSRARRGRSVRGDSHSVIVCPECRGHIPTRSDYGEPPRECGDCGARLRCESCGADLSQVDRGEESDLAAGYCPRCEDPVDGEGADPADEEFTWKDRQ